MQLETLDGSLILCAANWKRQIGTDSSGKAQWAYGLDQAQHMSIVQDLTSAAFPGAAVEVIKPSQPSRCATEEHARHTEAQLLRRFPPGHKDAITDLGVSKPPCIREPNPASTTHTRGGFEKPDIRETIATPERMALCVPATDGQGDPIICRSHPPRCRENLNRSAKFKWRTATKSSACIPRIPPTMSSLNTSQSCEVLAANRYVCAVPFVLCSGIQEPASSITHECWYYAQESSSFGIIATVAA